MKDEFPARCEDGGGGRVSFCEDNAGAPPSEVLQMSRASADSRASLLALAAVSAVVFPALSFSFAAGQLLISFTFSSGLRYTTAVVRGRYNVTL